MSKVFIEQTKSVIAEKGKSVAARALYGMCGGRATAWRDERQLRDMLFVICRVYGIKIFESSLEFATAEGVRRVNIVAEEAIAGMLANDGAFAKFTAEISEPGIRFAFDGSAKDIKRLGKSVLTVFGLNDIFRNAAISFDRLYCRPGRDRSNFYALSARMLHLHSPAEFFPYGNEIRSGTANFRSSGGCRLGEAALCGAEKSETEAVYRRAAKSLKTTANGLSAAGRNYLAAVALQYALCCFISAHGVPAGELSLPAAAAALVTGFQKNKTDEEIENIAKRLKKDMPFAQIRLYCRDVTDFNRVFAAYCALNKK